MRDPCVSFRIQPPGHLDGSHRDTRPLAGSSLWRWGLEPVLAQLGHLGKAASPACTCTHLQNHILRVRPCPSLCPCGIGASILGSEDGQEGCTRDGAPGTQGWAQLLLWGTGVNCSWWLMSSPEGEGDDPPSPTKTPTPFPSSPDPADTWACVQAKAQQAGLLKGKHRAGPMHGFY